MIHHALTELRALRERVPGVTNSLLAAVDGLLVVADAEETVDTESLSALAAAGLGLARRTSAALGQGVFRQNVVYSSAGYLAVYAVGDGALMAVLGDEGLQIGRLHQEAQPTIERIAAIFSAPEAAAS
ncbi:dynein regulation protein LC7 [Amycolatopsis rhizosphaerae]|uniref:Dynein regulation protein LC7 n=1 Tax=Amycolatopsis rhizosphaerae TaxID=2053003 RepID=A0A558DCW8_9PSEU|nr:roadblock/LC7 domain-containing protein [Amycolatopsis rhizosphaerae]TVT58870.1 dynein regulation protein LC7 [Amycolatopsis rhizosphaerae]